MATESMKVPSKDRSKIQDLITEATSQYSLKNYEAAADLYSQATELQTHLIGEMSPDNADLLYQYGRSLYHVAVSKSDVLGGKVAGEKPKKAQPKSRKAENSKSGDSKTAAGGGGKMAEVTEAAVELKEGMQNPTNQEREAANKPFFQFQGDENFQDALEEEEDGDEAEAEAEAEQEEDDFATAYEILDVARVLLDRRCRQATEHGKDMTTHDDSIRTLKDRLADTHDLQAEISLENERFHDAVDDFREALDLKKALHPEESSLIAEAHYKLSLALEFASQTGQNADGVAAQGKSAEEHLDKVMREEAVKEMEAAIASCRLRIQKEEAIAAGLDVDQAQQNRRAIADVKEMVEDMETRLQDLRSPAAPESKTTAADGPLTGILGSILGESKAEQKTRLDEATKEANDLSGLVRHKRKATTLEKTADADVDAAIRAGAEAEKIVNGGKGKRKITEAIEEGGPQPGLGKKAKTDGQIKS